MNSHGESRHAAGQFDSPGGTAGAPRVTLAERATTEQVTDPAQVVTTDGAASTGSASGPRLPSERRSVTQILIAGCALAVLLLLGVTGPLRLDQHPPSLQTNLASTSGVDWRGAARYLLLAAALLCGWLVAVRAALRLHRFGLRCVLAGSALLGAVLIPAHPTYSSDVFHYIATARVAYTHGANPLTTPPAAFAADPLMRLSGWATLPSPYGPLWTWLSWAPFRLSGGADDATRALLAFKALTLAGLLVAAAGIGRAAQRLHAGSGTAAVVIFAWNPLVLLHLVADAHNDAVMLAALAWSLVALLHGRLVLALLASGVATLIKVAAAVALATLALRLLGERRYAALALGAVAGAALLVVSFAPFWSGAETLRSGRDEAAYFTNTPASLALRLASTMGVDVRAETALSVIARLALLGALLYLVRWAGASRERLILAIGITYLLAAGLLATWFQPWYLTWPLLYFAVLPRRADARLLTIALTAGGLLVPLATNFAPAITDRDVDGAVIDLFAVLLAHGPVVIALLVVWGRCRHGPTGAAALG